MAKKTVLLPDDLAERSAKARARSRLLRENAISLAQALDMDVELLYVKDLSPGFFKKRQMDAFFNEYSAISENILDEFKKAGIKADIEIKAGSPAEEITSYISLSNKITMAVMATQTEKGFSKMLLGSVAEEVLRRAKIPVCIIGPTSQEKKSVVRLTPQSKILLLTDLSDSSLAAEKFTLNLCQHMACSPTVLHCVGEQIMKTRQAIYGSGYIPFNMEKTFEEMIEDAERSITRLSRKWKRAGFESRIILVTKEESVEKNLTQQLRKGFDLVIMGTHGRNRAMATFLGSTTRKVLAQSPVPVIVVSSVAK